MSTLTLNRFNAITQSNTHNLMLLSYGCIFALALLSIVYGSGGWDWRLAIERLAPENFSQFEEIQIKVL
ncbi:iron ABC transporter, partial [Pseudoalteromonas sp. S1612]